MDDFVNVTVRIKPIPEQDRTSLQIINQNPPLLLLPDKSQTFHFDKIFAEETNQTEVYNETVKPLVQQVKLGYNCTVFAYGQTGTGKTYTIGTDPDLNLENTGIISRTLEEFFQNYESDVEISISFIEIYNDKVFDLLNDHSKAPLPVKGFQVQGFRQEIVDSMPYALHFLKTGGRNRHTGETKQNASSSRSHAIFTVYCRIKSDDQDTMAKLNLVDLAGSESVRKTGNQGSSFHEGISINKGLLSLGQVMAALASKSNHIPYRQSIITTILHDSLNKNNFVSLIACVSASPADVCETQQTLEFAARVKKMKNKPEVNHFMRQYKKDNPTLFTPRGLTPNRRTTVSGSYDYYTPALKRRRALPKVPEAFNAENGSNFDTQSITSFSPESVSSMVSGDAANLSPVIRKYTSAMESSIVNKLEHVIQETLQKQTLRRSCRVNKENVGLNTPTFNWDKMADFVRSEILRMTGKNRESGSDRPIGNSSPIDSFAPRKQLVFTENVGVGSAADDVDIFKVPTAAMRRKNNKREKTSTAKSRRSSGLLNRSVINEDDVVQEPLNRRRSVRLQQKVKDVAGLTPAQEPKKSRCSKCLKTKVHTLIDSDRNAVDSPVTRRSNEVLNVLNSGNLKDIVKLQTIGQKTAEKILFFRELKGSFKAISDLADMPYWTKNKYKKFVTENFLLVD